MSKIILTLFITFLFVGCGKYDLENRINLANTITKEKSFKKLDIQSSTFKLRTYSKFLDNTKPLKIYIEGDGFAFVSRYSISNNPTPLNPVALKLSQIDKGENIAYIARPCQYIQSYNCNQDYWTDKRFSKEVIKSINQTITKLKELSKTKEIELIGFSGGGAIVTLVASLRDDIVKITTIAGNLNHKLLHNHHKVPHIYGSLNPIDVAKDISHIKQIHYVGEDDKIVPSQIAYSFKEASKNKKDIEIIILPNTTHTKGWRKIYE